MINKDQECSIGKLEHPQAWNTSSQIIPYLRIQQLQRSSKGEPRSHLSATGPKGFDSLSFPAALSSYPSLNIFPISTPPSYVDIPSQEEKVSYMAQHASTEGKFSVCFFTVFCSVQKFLTHQSVQY